METNKTLLNLEAGESLSVFKSAEVHAKLVEAYNSADSLEIDLNSVTDCDTAGIQLLYSLKKSGIKDGKKITIKNISCAVEDTLNRMCIPINTII